MPVQNPVVVVPGITATDLIDVYPPGIDTVWSTIRHREFNRLALHPDDLRYEAIEPARVVARKIFSVYDSLVHSLRHELSWHADEPTPVFAFPYDWRANVGETAVSLSAFLDEVIDRTRLIPHYRSTAPQRVDLVGHSMGGLVILEYLSQAGGESKAAKVVTLGTPFRGSIEAIVKLATGLGTLTGDEPAAREREVARVTPTVYQLLPSYAGAAVDDSGAGVDLFDASHMQDSVLASIREHVRLYSGAPNLEESAGAILSDLLTAARRHRATVEEFRLSDVGLARKDWLTVIGTGQPTRARVRVRKGPHGIRFSFAEEPGAKEEAFVGTGDGTVPLEAAIPPFLPRTQPVCVSRRDLGLFELADQALVRFAGLHAMLPRMNLVHRIILQHIAQGPYRGQVWGRRVPGARTWNPPIAGLREVS